MFVVKIGPELLEVVKVKATIGGKNYTKRRDNYLNIPYMCFFTILTYTIKALSVLGNHI